LYAGAGIAALLHLCLRPQLTGRFLAVHAGFILSIAPFGFHWMPQEPVLRTVSGLLYGFGVFAFLWCPISRRFPGGGWIGSRPIRSRSTAYAIGLAVTAGLLPLLAACGGRLAAYALSSLVLFGLTALAAVICGDAVLTLSRGAQFLPCRTQPRRLEIGENR
jgi:hypothetical protein